LQQQVVGSCVKIVTVSQQITFFRNLRNLKKNVSTI
jgi:hypothetical protein